MKKEWMVLFITLLDELNSSTIDLWSSRHSHSLRLIIEAGVDYMFSTNQIEAEHLELAKLNLTKLMEIINRKLQDSSQGLNQGFLEEVISHADLWPWAEGYITPKNLRK